MLLPEDVEAGLFWDGTRGVAPVILGRNTLPELVGADPDLLANLAAGAVPLAADTDLTPVLVSGTMPGADLGRLLLRTQVFRTWEALVRLF